MRFVSRFLHTAAWTATALLIAACTPDTPPTGAAVPASTGADPTPSAEPLAGPTHEAPCARFENGMSPSADTPPRLHAFAKDEDIRACVHLRAQADGGRRTAVFSGYRPDVRFVDNAGGIVATQRCAVRFDANGAVEPGSTVAAHLECEAPVELEDGSTLVLVEGGREVGSGVVVLPPA